MYEFYNKYNI